MRRTGAAIVAFTTWAERVRPRWRMVVGVLAAVGGLWKYLHVDRQLPLWASLCLGVTLGAFYVVPWLVAIVRGFAAGYRETRNPA